MGGATFLPGAKRPLGVNMIKSVTTPCEEAILDEVVRCQHDDGGGSERKIIGKKKGAMVDSAIIGG